MNSFRFLERGIEAELERQRGLLDAGEQVEQETLHYHPEDGSLTPLRSKEYAHDYRYFPEPDLVPVAPTEAMIAEAREALPELPAARRERYVDRGRALGGGGPTLAFQAAYGEYFERALEAADGVSAEGDRQLGHRRAGRGAASRRRRGGPARLEGDPRGRRRAGRTGRGEGDLARLGQAGAREAGRRGRRPRRDRRERGPRADLRQRRARGDRRPRRSRRSPRPPSRFGPATRRRRAGSWARVMKETKGRADGGEVRADPRALVTTSLQALGSGILTPWPGTSSSPVVVSRERPCARELERLLPKQSARLIARQRRQLHPLHAVPARGRGRDCWSRATSSRRCARSSTAPTCGSARSPRTTRRRAPSSCETHDGETERAPLRPARPLARLGLADASRSRAWPSTRSASRASPTRSGCETTSSRRSRRRTRPRTRSAASALLTYVFVGGGYAGPRGARRAPGLRRRRDGPLSARAAARDALDPGRGDRPGAARDRRRRSPTTRCASCAAAGSRSGSGPRSRQSTPTAPRLSTGETVPTRTVVWTAGVVPHPSLADLSRAARRARPGRSSTTTCASRACRASGRSATAPRSPTRRAGTPRRPPSTDPPGAGWSPERRRRARRGEAPAATATRARRPSSTSAATRRWARSAGSPSRASSPGGWPGPTT